MSTAVTDNDRYVVISADSHAGGSHEQYREYLDKASSDEFDAWRNNYKNPFSDLQDDGRTRNWDSDLRWPEMEADGSAAEVVFPNTVPPFFPTGAVIARPPTPRSTAAASPASGRTTGGWPTSWPSTRAPGRRRPDLPQRRRRGDQGRRVRRTEHGIRGGVLLPGRPDDATWVAAALQPVLRQALGRLPGPRRHRHPPGGQGSPDYGDFPAAGMLGSPRPPTSPSGAMTHLILGGVFERFPGLKYVLAEQGCAWVPPVLTAWDTFHQEMRDTGRVGELGFPVEEVLPMAPSDYVKRNVWFAASFPGKGEVAAAREVLGTDRVMWASDYPHHEGTWPYTVRRCGGRSRACRSRTPPRCSAATPSSSTASTATPCAPLASEWGPTVEEVAVPIAGRPEGATSPAFAR